MYRKCLFLLLCSCVFALGCGDSDENPPEIEPPTAACDTAPSDSYAETDIVSEISVRVQDPDRDLTSVTASANGVMLGELTDDDGDQRFNWSPPLGFGPIICRGTLSIRVIAEDVRGNGSERTGSVDLDVL